MTLNYSASLIFSLPPLSRCKLLLQASTKKKIRAKVITMVTSLKQQKKERTHIAESLCVVPLPSCPKLTRLVVGEAGKARQAGVYLPPYRRPVVVASWSAVE